MKIKEFIKRMIKEEDGFLPILGALAGLAGGAATLGGATAVGTGLGAIGGGLSALGSATKKNKQAEPPPKIQGLQMKDRPDINSRISQNVGELQQQTRMIEDAMNAMKDPSITNDIRQQYSEPLLKSYMTLKGALKQYTGAQATTPELQKGYMGAQTTPQEMNQFRR